MNKNIWKYDELCEHYDYKSDYGFAFVFKFNEKWRVEAYSNRGEFDAFHCDSDDLENAKGWGALYLKWVTGND